MPAKTDRRHRQGQESRQRILKGALEIAAERGYDGTTMALITERTGLPASSVYWQFKNKDELLAEALDYSYRTWRRLGPTWQPANYSGTPTERIITRLGHSAKSVQQQPEYWRLGLMVVLLRKSEKIAAQERFMRVRRETILIISEWWQTFLPLEAGSQPELVDLLTRAHLNLVDGMFVAHRADPTTDLDGLVAVLGPAIGTVVERWTADPAATLAMLHRARSAAPEPDLPHAPAAEEDSRTRLLGATAEIAAERGYRGTTISRICARAGVPVSSVYWFFADKDDLLAEVVQHSWDGWIASQPEWRIPAAGDDPADELRRILRRAVQSLLDAPAFMRLGHMLTLEQHGPDVAARARFLEIRVGIRRTIQNWFDQTIDQETVSRLPGLPRLLAEAVIAYTDGYFLGSQIDDTEQAASGLVEFMVAVLSEAASWAPSGSPDAMTAR